MRLIAQSYLASGPGSGGVRVNILRPRTHKDQLFKWLWGFCSQTQVAICVNVDFQALASGTQIKFCFLRSCNLYLPDFLKSVKNKGLDSRWISSETSRLLWIGKYPPNSVWKLLLHCFVSWLLTLFQALKYCVCALAAQVCVLKAEECGDGLCNHLSDTHIPGLHTSCHTLQHANLCLSLFLRVCLTSEEIFCLVFLLRVKQQRSDFLPTIKSFSVQTWVSRQVTVFPKTSVSNHAPNSCTNVLDDVGLMACCAPRVGPLHSWTDSSVGSTQTLTFIQRFCQCLLHFLSLFLLFAKAVASLVDTPVNHWVISPTAEIHCSLTTKKSNRIHSSQCVSSHSVQLRCWQDASNTQQSYFCRCDA